MNGRYAIAVGALAMAVAVVLGAFGAHALKARLAVDAMATWQTAVQYQAWHALGLMGVGLWMERWLERRGLRVAAWLLVVGILLFSGSLYAVALTGLRALGAITPIGGVAWIVAWVLVAVAALRTSR